MLKSIVLIFLIHQAFLELVEPSSHNFSFRSFNAASCDKGHDLICWGSVNAGNGSLNITPDQPLDPKDSSQVGRVLYRYPISIWPASFSTTFTIKISSNSTASGDGIAFIIAHDNSSSPSDSYGSFIGIMDPSTEETGLKQLAVELDTYKNAREIDGNHIAIVTTSIEYPIAVRSLTDIGINLKSGRNITFKIEYNGWTKLLQINAAYANEPLINVLSHKIIMKDTVPQQAYVGFTGSTAHVHEIHHILDWNFTLYELSDESLSKGVSRNKRKIVLEIVIPIILVSLSVGVMIFLVRVRKGRKERLRRRDDIEMLTKNAANAPKIFSHKQLLKATRNFSEENLLGRGGFGSVYKGILSHFVFPTTVAVKKINATSSQGEREYLAEICTIGRLRHKNLVQLQGWCHEKEQLLLVYEYMPNGSLDRYIGKVFLDWQTRQKILSGLASALLYLHEECDHPIVHRDVKPNNVMLDSDYNAHLGDFGLARLVQNNGFVSTMVAGTIGYLAPEVSYTGRATPESDVYSFGMVVLEVVMGRRSKGIMDEFSLVDHVWNAYEKGSLSSCVDGMLGNEFDEEQAKRSLVLGLACLHPSPMLRPKMRKVVQIFMNSDEPLMKLPDSRPTEVCFSLSSSSPSTTTFNTDLGSVNGNTHDWSSVESPKPDEMTVRYEGCHSL